MRAAARAAIGRTMRMSALRLPLCAWGKFFRGVVVGKARARRRAARTLVIASGAKQSRAACVRRWIASSLRSARDDRMHPPPRVARGRGTMRSMVEGVCGAEAGREAEPLPPPFGRSPFPLRGGRMKRGDHAARRFLYVRPAIAKRGKTKLLRRSVVAGLWCWRGVAVPRRHVTFRTGAERKTKRGENKQPPTSIRRTVRRRPQQPQSPIPYATPKGLGPTLA